MNRVAEIKHHITEANRLVKESFDHHWDAARLMTEEIAETGKTQRQLADVIGQSVSHVNKCLKIWEEYGSVSPEKRPLWQAAYDAKSSRKPKATPEPTPDPEGTEPTPTPSTDEVPPELVPQFKSAEEPKATDALTAAWLNEAERIRDLMKEGKPSGITEEVTTIFSEALKFLGSK